MVRGTVTGSENRVLVIASAINNARRRRDSSAGEDMVQKIQTENWTDFDAMIATPDMMRSVGRFGKILAPRGLKPNPKTGTVTVERRAGSKWKAGKVEFRVDKTGVIHVPVGKVSFASDKLLENANTLLNAVVKAKPSAAKGKHVERHHLCPWT